MSIPILGVLHINLFTSYNNPMRSLNIIIPILWRRKLGWNSNGLDWSALKAKPIPYFILPRAWDAERAH